MATDEGLVVHKVSIYDDFKSACGVPLGSAWSREERNVTCTRCLHQLPHLNIEAYENLVLKKRASLLSNVGIAPSQLASMLETVVLQAQALGLTLEDVMREHTRQLMEEPNAR